MDPLHFPLLYYFSRRWLLDPQSGGGGDGRVERCTAMPWQRRPPPGTGTARRSSGRLLKTLGASKRQFRAARGCPASSFHPPSVLPLYVRPGGGGAVVGRERGGGGGALQLQKRTTCNLGANMKRRRKEQQFPHELERGRPAALISH